MVKQYELISRFPTSHTRTTELGLSFLAIDCESAEPFRAMSATSPPVTPSRLATVPQMPGSRDHCLSAL